jgi:1-deoxy-D-xylulose-5-phosphate reductoisomerase
LDYPSLTFEKVNNQVFQNLDLAYRAMEAEGVAACFLNAANEVAVAAFLDKQIRFDQIHLLNMKMMERVLPTAITGLEDLLELDQRSRMSAKQFVMELA